MDLEKLTREQMELLILEFAKRGKMTEGEMEQVVNLALSHEDRNTIGAYHSIMCNLDHELEGGCDYYQEEVLENTWGRRDHILWTNNSKSFMQECGLTNYRQLRDAITQATDFAQKASRIPGCAKLLYHLLA